jgi:hypothetical protein
MTKIIDALDTLDRPPAGWFALDVMRASGIGSP